MNRTTHAVAVSGVRTPCNWGRKLLTVVAAFGLGMIAFGAAPAMAHDHGFDRGGHYGHGWGWGWGCWAPAHYYAPAVIGVYAAPVYRTERIWIEPVTRVETERVWVPERWELRTRVIHAGWRDEVITDRVLVEPGHWVTRDHVVIVAPGHWEDRVAYAPACGEVGVSVGVTVR